ncbi:MAG: hypothetical protein V9F04_16320 [Dermatophilaceae bacterium]
MSGEDEAAADDSAQEQPDNDGTQQRQAPPRAGRRRAVDGGVDDEVDVGQVRHDRTMHSACAPGAKPDEEGGDPQGDPGRKGAHERAECIEVDHASDSLSDREGVDRRYEHRDVDGIPC